MQSDLVKCPTGAVQLTKLGDEPDPRSSLIHNMFNTALGVEVRVDRKSSLDEMRQ